MSTVEERPTSSSSTNSTTSRQVDSHVAPRRVIRSAGRPRAAPEERSATGRQAAGERRVPSPAALRARRRGLIRLAVLVLVLLGVVVSGVLLLSGTLFGVRSVDVAGVALLPADEVRAATGLREGQSMLRLDTAAVAASVAALPPVAEVRVERSWPSTVVLRITERAPVAFAATPTGARLIDHTGLGFITVPAPPPGLPVLRAADGPPTQAAAVVLAVLTDPARQALRAELLSASAESPADVRLELRGGRTVRWGSAADSARKADVLAALLSQPGSVYDVASPDLPTVR